MSLLFNASVFVALLSAFLVMVEKFSPDLREAITMDKLSPEIQEWYKKGSLHDIDGYKVFAIVEGQGDETLILVHGFPSSSFDYHRAIQHLTKDYRVVMFDHLGFGFSDKPNHTYTYSMADQAEIALRLWKKLGIKSAHIIAHDMGDSVLTEILSRRQRKVLPDYFENFFESITFTNGGVVFEHANLRVSQMLFMVPKIGPFFSSLKNKLPSSISDSFTRQQLRSIWSPLYEEKATMEQDISHMMQLIKLGGGEDVFHKTILYLQDRGRFEPRWLDSLSKIDIPCLVLWGDADAVAPMEIPKALAQNVLPKDKFMGRIVKNAGHFIMLENPKAWADTIKYFVTNGIS